MYAEARSYVLIEISLEKPLVPKASAAELAARYRVAQVDDLGLKCEGTRLSRVCPCCFQAEVTDPTATSTSSRS